MEQGYSTRHAAAAEAMAERALQRQRVLAASSQLFQAVYAAPELVNHHMAYRRLHQPPQWDGLISHDFALLRKLPFERIARAQGGDKVLALILSYAAETVDVVTRSDYGFPKNRLTEAARTGEYWERTTQNTTRTIPVTYYLRRIEVKLRLVCKHWRKTIDDPDKVNLHLVPTKVVRISERYLHELDIPLEALTYNPLYQPEHRIDAGLSRLEVENKFTHCQISFVSNDSSCTTICEDRSLPGNYFLGTKKCRCAVPKSVQLVELRFCPKPNPNDDTPHLFSPMCYFRTIGPQFSTQSVAFTVPYLRNAAAAPSFRALQYVNPFHGPTPRGVSGPYLQIPKALMLNIHTWRAQHMAFVPAILAATIEALTADLPPTRALEQLSIVLPPRAHSRAAMLQSWRTHALDAVQPDPLTPRLRLLSLVNITTPLWSHLAYLSNIVPSVIAAVTISPPSDRQIYSAPCTRYLPAAPAPQDPAAAAWDAALAPDAFDYTLFSPRTWQRDMHGLRMRGPGGTSSPALNDSAHLGRLLALRSGQAGLHPVTSDVRRRTTDGGDAVVEPRAAELAGYRRQFNAYVGERGEWRGLRQVWCAHASVRDVRGMERAGIEELQGVRGRENVVYSWIRNEMFVRTASY